jgi:hypothetical protein
MIPDAPNREQILALALADYASDPVRFRKLD